MFVCSVQIRAAGVTKTVMPKKAFNTFGKRPDRCILLNVLVKGEAMKVGGKVADVVSQLGVGRLLMGRSRKMDSTTTVGIKITFLSQTGIRGWVYNLPCRRMPSTLSF